MDTLALLIELKWVFGYKKVDIISLFHRFDTF